MKEKEKTTVPIPSVGADGEQSLSYVSNEIIATESEEFALTFKTFSPFSTFSVMSTLKGA